MEFGLAAAGNEKLTKRVHILVDNQISEFAQAHPGGMGRIVRLLIEQKMREAHTPENMEIAELRKKFDIIKPEYLAIRARLDEIEALMKESTKINEDMEKKTKAAQDALLSEMRRERGMPHPLMTNFYAKVLRITSRELREWCAAELAKIQT